jgi:hypothetical protein
VGLPASRTERVSLRSGVWNTPVPQEIPSAPAWSRVKTPAAPITGPKKYPEQETGSKNNFSQNLDFFVQFLNSSGKLGIFTEKACHDYHNVVVNG